MGDESRHESGPQDQEGCPGVFCLYTEEEEEEGGGGGGGGGKSKRGRRSIGTLFNTENAMRKEREALQDTLTSFRRTMAATSSLITNTSKIRNKDDSEDSLLLMSSSSMTNVNGSGGSGLGGDVALRSMLGVYEADSGRYMTPNMRAWCLERDRLHGAVCSAIQVTEPTIGQELVLCETFFIRWSNKNPSKLNGIPGKLLNTRTHWNR